MAFVKELRYLSAKVSVTGSCRSMMVCSSLSTDVFWRHVSARPMSPTVENFTPSFLTEMDTVTPMEERSRQMR